MKTYYFELTLTNKTGEDLYDKMENLVEKFYEAGCDDMTFSMSCGVFHADVARESDSLELAISSAKAQLERVASDLRVEVTDISDIRNSN